jgi:hypothetical protein
MVTSPNEVPYFSAIARERAKLLRPANMAKGVSNEARFRVQNKRKGWLCSHPY